MRVKSYILSDIHRSCYFDTLDVLVTNVTVSSGIDNETNEREESVDILVQ